MKSLEQPLHCDRQKLFAVCIRQERQNYFIIEGRALFFFLRDPAFMFVAGQGVIEMLLPYKAKDLCRA